MGTRKFGKVGALLLGGAVLGGYALQPIRPVVFVGESMSPTYRHGEVAWGIRPNRDLRRGDVVVVNCEWGRIVKRVAHLPGELIEQYFVQNEWIDPKDSDIRLTAASLNRFPKRTFYMPDDAVFLLGDNRGVSLDSRLHGPFKTSDIVAILMDARPRKTQAFVSPFAARSRGGDWVAVSWNR